MAIMNFIRRQLIDIIEWTDDSRDTISFRFPDEDREIKNGAQLIVRESQVAQFVYLGEFGHVRARQAHADDRQHPDPHITEVVEVRVRVALQSRRVLRHDAAVHR
jgi:membrane protease subunit (stomatin/prohibitin family)